MSQQKPITLFPGVEILQSITMQHVIKYLKRYCAVDVLGDTLYVKRPGNDFTTFAIEFDSDEVYKVRKIKDEKGNNLDDGPIYEKDYFDDSDEL